MERTEAEMDRWSIEFKERERDISFDSDDFAKLRKQCENNGNYVCPACTLKGKKDYVTYKRAGITNEETAGSQDIKMGKSKVKVIRAVEECIVDKACVFCGFVKAKYKKYTVRVHVHDDRVFFKVRFIRSHFDMSGLIDDMMDEVEPGSIFNWRTVCDKVFGYGLKMKACKRIMREAEMKGYIMYLRDGNYVRTYAWEEYALIEKIRGVNEAKKPSPKNKPKDGAEFESDLLMAVHRGDTNLAKKLIKQMYSK